LVIEKKKKKVGTYCPGSDEVMQVKAWKEGIYNKLSICDTLWIEHENRICSIFLLIVVRGYIFHQETKTQ
jgi:hypothetical protein